MVFQTVSQSPLIAAVTMEMTVCTTAIATDGSGDCAHHASQDSGDRGPDRVPDGGDDAHRHLNRAPMSGIAASTADSTDCTAGMAMATSCETVVITSAMTPTRSR